MFPQSAESLQQLRHSVAEIEGRPVGLSEAEQGLSLGVPALDAALGGGLARDALHELAPSLPVHSAAATGFALALAARARGDVLWVQTDFVRMESGVPYGPGLDLYGLSLQRLTLLCVPHAVDVLWAMEEGLRSRAVKAVIGEVPDAAADDMTALRRLSLTARDGGAFGLILRTRPSLSASAAVTRWEVASAPGPRDDLGGLGRTAFALSLTKNRRGPCGPWLLTWDHHDHAFFPTLSVGVAEAARDRSDRAPLARIG